MTASISAFVLLVIAALVWLGRRAGRSTARIRALRPAIAGISSIQSPTCGRSRLSWAAASSGCGTGSGFRRRLRRNWPAGCMSNAPGWCTTAPCCCWPRGVLIWIIHLWRKGDASAGDVVVVFGLTTRIMHSSKDMGLAFVDIVQNLGYIDEILRVIAQPPPWPIWRSQLGWSAHIARSSSNGSASATAAIATPFTISTCGCLLVRKSASSARPALESRILVQLLQRLHDVGSGQIFIDGEPITEWSRDSLRSALAVVPQEVSLFHRTVMENVRFAQPTATDAEVFEAVKSAGCGRPIPRGPAARLPHPARRKGSEALRRPAAANWDCAGVPEGRADTHP